MFRFGGGNGGWNKTHGQIEKTPRVDSFELAQTDTWSGVLCGGKWLETYHDGEDCVLFPVGSPPGGIQIGLSSKHNGFGGKQMFFLCPACGQRVRFLYQSGGGFLCRKCARLNYRSQQENRSDSMYYYRKGMALVDKRLYTWPRFRPDGFDFPYWIPERPRYMHQTTYRRHLTRFLRYQQRYESRYLADLRLLLGPAAWAEVLRLQEEDV